MTAAEVDLSAKRHKWVYASAHSCYKTPCPVDRRTLDGESTRHRIIASHAGLKILI
jgi:hypothetical protein